MHLQAGRTPGLTNLGDSTRLLEAIDFVRRTAGKQPWACNCSLGRTGGPHDASTLVEQAIDALLKTPGCAVVMSTGNYNAHHTHAYGVLSPGERRTLEWRVFPSDRTMNELEIWYPGTDRLRVAVRSPDGRLVGRAELSERMAFSQNGHQIGRIYHRSHDPNNADNHIDIFLSKTAPFGTWRVELEAEHVESGRYYAWIERDPGPPGTQSRFNPASVSHECTTAERIAKAFQGAIREGRTHSESYAYTEARTRSSEEDLGRAYSVLGVDPDVSDTTLHEVWRQARKANHPDLVEQDSPEHRRRTRASAELNDAYQYVRESRRRA